MGIARAATAALIAIALPAAAGVAVATPAPTHPARNVILRPVGTGITPRVIGGHTARRATWPYITSVLSPEGLCTGELIGARWVLTARHCVTSESTGAVFAAGAMRVSIGVGPLTSQTGWLTPVRIVSFPGYRPATSFGDLALIQLRAPNTTQTAEPATTSPDRTLTLDARIAGWGLTSNFAQNPPNFPQEAATKLWPQSYCRGTYPTVFDAATELCAGGPDPEHDDQYPSVCNGDSGGPLVLPGTGGAWTDRLVGITDYGADAGCDVAPNAFQSVPAHLAWIRAVTGLGPVRILRAHQTAAGHSNAIISVRLQAAQARTTILVIAPNGQSVAARRALAWHPQTVKIIVPGLVPGATVRGYRVITLNAYGMGGPVGVVLRTVPVRCVLRAGGACPATNLTGRNLAGRDLHRIDLRLSNLTRASLTRTNLTGARLAGANLTGAVMTGARLSGAGLARVVWSHTTCPDGTDSATNATHPESCIGH
jgi:hypothetical protein